MTENNNTVKWRLTKLEEKVDGTDEKVDKILENHLPHMLLELEKLRSEVAGNKIKIAAIAAGISLFVSAIVEAIFKSVL